VLQSFLARHDVSEDTWLVLNGLPRHVGQARSLDSIAHVHTVVALVCSPEVVMRRIATNAGGDRGERTDDGQADVRRKLTIYAERTAPLVDHYRQQGAQVVELTVTAEMSAEQMWERLDRDGALEST
jgi:adenylate kinase